jgi:hypothetical protein
MRKEAYELLHRGAFIPAMPLVLHEDRSFDERGQRRLIRYYLACGADGIAAGVHSTQFAIRDPKVGLFEPVLRCVQEEIAAYRARAGREVLAIAGVCGKTEQAIREAEQAVSWGYDAVLLSPGGLNAESETYLVDRHRQVAKAAPMIGFYLQPAVGGRLFSFDYWRKVCEIDGVEAVKCAAFNRYCSVDVARAIAESGRDIALYTGNDDNIIADLLTVYRFTINGKDVCVPTVGGLLGHWGAWTHKAVEIFREIRALPEDAPVPRSMLTLAAQVTDVNGAFFDAKNQFRGCIAGMHEVLRRQGLMGGVWLLDEKEGLSPGQKEEIDRVYRQYPDLNDDAFVADFLQGDA